jgi:omega-hydroxy-beta-dihydromenaquinone-9 sulfotransferase
MVATAESTRVDELPAVPERLPTEPEAIFVVGVARSGTTLMRKLLETSERIGIARENHYVGHLFERQGARFYFRRAGDLKDDATIKAIVDSIYSGGFQKQSRWRRISPYWRWVTEATPKEELERRLLATDRTERGFMEALMRLHSDLMGRPLMGEKTPAHLKFVETLLEWFPGGKVIHMMRDPRAVYVSDRYRRKVKGRKPWSLLAKVPLLLESVLLVQTVLVWRGGVKRHDELTKKFPDRYMLVQFEDVVRKPETTMPAVFEFLKVELPDFTTVFVSQAHGMRASAEGIDPAAADRWRERLRPFPKRFLEAFLRGPMRRFGYTD